MAGDRNLLGGAGLHAKPDYSALRAETPFTWSVSATYLALLEVTGIPIRRFNLDPAAGVELYRKGWPMLREMFGEDVALWGPSTPPISYGHVNGLGSRLTFPDGG